MTDGLAQETRRPHCLGKHLTNSNVLQYRSTAQSQLEELETWGKHISRMALQMLSDLPEPHSVGKGLVSSKEKFK